MDDFRSNQGLLINTSINLEKQKTPILVTYLLSYKRVTHYLLSSLSLLFTCKQEENSIFHFIEKHTKTRQLPEVANAQRAQTICNILL